nr:chemotaxis protein CheX [uncultured Caproiciproducens sp.]
MNKEYMESFSSAFLNVMPQLGVVDVKRNSETECGHLIKSPGVVVIIGITGDLHGNVYFTMGEDCAKKVASSMMGGMDVPQFDEMVQSAVSELSNMLAATACTDLSGKGINADISTPTLIHGDFTADASLKLVTCLEMLADGWPFYIYLSLEQK